MTFRFFTIFCSLMNLHMPMIFRSLMVFRNLMAYLLVDNVSQLDGLLAC
jgi:hypothetical protein